MQYYFLKKTLHVMMKGFVSLSVTIVYNNAGKTYPLLAGRNLPAPTVADLENFRTMGGSPARYMSFDLSVV